MIWFRINSTPVRQFYQDAGALPLLNPKLASHALLVDAGTLRSTTGNENASMTLALKNTSGECSQLFANPPLGASVDVFEDAEIVFQGTFTQIDLDATSGKLQVQA